MGQKRTQNIIDQKIGAYLASFETELLGKIDRVVTERLDYLIDKEKSLQQTAESVEQSSEKAARSLDNFQGRIGLYVLGLCALSGVIGGLVVFLLLLWLW